jgi:3-deoxy-D-manno-octulosonate 8-phosphate phosphatase (KDO 8-P phosphatase)
MTPPRLLVLDVDGVLTDGTFLLPSEGDEWKAFHAADGLGLRFLMDAGVAVALLSGRRSAVRCSRCAR